MEFERLVRGTSGLTYLVERKKLIQKEIIDRILTQELSEINKIEIQMLDNEYRLICLELKLIDLELKRESILANN